MYTHTYINISSTLTSTCCYVYVCIYIHMYAYIYIYTYQYIKQFQSKSLIWACGYGVAAVGRLLKIIGLFCRIQSLL